MPLRRRKSSPPTEADQAKAARAAADLEALRGDDPFEELDDGREWSGGPRPGGVKPVDDELAALGIEIPELDSEIYRSLKASLRFEEARLEKREDKLKHSGDDVRQQALANLERETARVDALRQRVWELEELRILEGVWTCPRCRRELPDHYALTVHKLDRNCRRPD